MHTVKKFEDFSPNSFRLEPLVFTTHLFTPQTTFFSDRQKVPVKLHASEDNMATNKTNKPETKPADLRIKLDIETTKRLDKYRAKIHSGYSQTAAVRDLVRDALSGAR